MHKAILKDLSTVDVSNIGLTKKTLGKIYLHIRYCSNKKDLRSVAQIGHTLSYFISTNSKQTYQNMSLAYRHKRFIQECSNLLNLCLETCK